MSNAETLQAGQDFEVAAQPKAGALLKQAREASGLHIAALAVLLKVPVKKLEALESDRFDLLPDAVFVRALASSVCRTLKVDSSTILSRLPRNDAPKLSYQRAAINEPFCSPGDRPSPSIWARVSRPSVFSGVFLLFGALVLIFLPNIKTGLGGMTSELPELTAKNTATEKSTAVITLAESPLSTMMSSSAAVPAPGLVPAPTRDSANANVPVAAGESVSPAASGQLPALAPTDLNASKSSPAVVVTANAQTASNVVLFTAKTESWVEATDAKGQVVLRRTLVAGEIVGASGALPLKVIVGRANAIQVEIRGKSFDVTAIAKDNVARFEVK